MSYVASGGETRNEFARVLHFPNDNQKLMKDLAGLRRELEAAAKHKRTTVTVANAFGWIRPTRSFARTTWRRWKRPFPRRFVPPSSLTGRRPAAKSTNGLPNRRMTESGTWSARTISSRGAWLDVINKPGLVSVNAVYFKADWGSRFERARPRPGRFM